MKQKLPVVIMATRDPDAFAAIRAGDAQIVEVVTTRGMLQALERNPAMVIADPDGLLVTNGVTLAMAAQALETARANGVLVLKPSDVASRALDVSRLGRAKVGSGVRYVLPRLVLVASYAGGIGKTTTSLTLARCFVKNTGLRAAVIEAGVGASVLLEKLGIKDAPTLYGVSQMGVKPTTWNGVSLLPLSAQEAAAFDDDALKSEIARLREEHALLIVDASPQSPLWGALLALADTVLIPLTPRSDTQRQAETLFEELVKDGYPAQFVMNMVAGVQDRISFSKDVIAYLAYRPEQARAFVADLALPLLNAIYPGVGKATGGIRGFFGL